MGKMEEKLKGNNFHRIHRSSLININHIESIDRDYVEVGGTAIKISPSKKDEFLQRINSI